MTVLICNFRYNFCRGSLEEIKQRMRDLYQYWIIPNFKNVTPEWEHMTRCVVVPFNYYRYIYIPYKVRMNGVTRLEFLSYHFLLASGSKDGHMAWLDVCIGKLVSRYNSHLGRISVSFINFHINFLYCNFIVHINNHLLVIGDDAKSK